MADFQAMQKNSRAQAHIEAIAALAQFEPVVCEVADAIEAAPKSVERFATDFQYAIDLSMDRRIETHGAEIH